MTQISTFFGLNQTLRGLLAHQRAMDTTGHNITNANTEGYSRQEAVFAAATPYSIEAGLLVDGGGAMLGGGVDIQAFRRIKDGFLDLQFRAQSLRLGDYQTTTSATQQVEDGLSEPGDNGISAQLDKFWSSWSAVANNPENLATRQNLVEQAKTLAGAINDLDARLNTVKGQLNAEYASLTSSTGDVKSMADEIAKLNQAIKDAIAGGDQPNDLYDRRDLLLDKLSSLAQVSHTTLPNGAITVTFGDAATPLVDDNTVSWPQTLTNPGGKLGALLNLTKPALPAPGGTIESYRADLNAFAKKLADDVNAIHNPGGAGTNFFTYGTATTAAASLVVSVAATGVRATNGTAAGANDVAVAMAKLRGTAPDQAYQALVARIGSEVRNSQRQEANANVLASAIDDRRQSISGVSMDEEMTNLVRFQRGYQASARAMNTVDEMLDQLINRTGRVGL
ncbi:MAG: flagellar hook-associated protein 1 [Thermoleophilales bacterium]|jgi:flagellar hook-associated protein 1 FlgK|nr:flagellar hook-associated protein 1 [Thermoleophilales bacterium]